MPLRTGHQATLAVALAAGTVVAAGAAADAATFQIAMAGQTTTFDAPAMGGAMSGFSISIAGTTFDTALMAGQAPVYDPVDNDIQGATGLFGYFTNSVAGPGCAASTCFIEFEASNMGAPPKLWTVFPVIMGFPGGVTSSGSYTISPGPPGPGGIVPLPASAWLLAAALAVLGGAIRRRAPA